jgi:hypothetical protein
MDKNILTSGTSAILLNGIPGKQFVCKRGVRQGDPLSPLLYSLGSDLLQSAVNDLDNELFQGLLRLMTRTSQLSSMQMIRY